MKMRQFLVLCASLLSTLSFGSWGHAQSTVIQSVGVAGIGNRQSTSFLPSTMTPAQRKWESILDQTNPEIGRTPMQMNHLVGQLQSAGLPVLLDQTARDDSLDDLETIRLQLPGEPLRVRLRHALQEHNACLAILGDRLLVISLDVAEDPSFFLTLSYDVTALAADADSLIESLKYSVDPDGWDDTNGDASLTPITINNRNVLSLSASYHTHVKFRQFLSQLHRLTGGSRWGGNDLASSSRVAGSHVIILPSATPLYSRGQDGGKGARGRGRGRGSGIGGFGGGGGVF